MSVFVCVIPFNSLAGELRNRQCFISDSCNVNKVAMVNRKSVGWSRGRRAQGHGKCQADNDDVIAHELTGGDLTGNFSL